MISSGTTPPSPFLLLHSKSRAMVIGRITWEEIERGIEPQQFTIDVVLRRVARDGDLFAPVLSGKLKLPH